MWSSSYSENEEEETMNIYDPQSIDSDMLENMSSSVWKY